MIVSTLDLEDARKFIQQTIREAEQPFFCADAEKCNGCSRRMMPHHLHCCGQHLHVTGGGQCFTAHWMEHASGQRPGPFAPFAAWQQRVAGQKTTRATIHRLFQEDRCSMCASTRSLTIDHIDASLKGTPEDGPHNWATLCSDCHQLKTRARGDGRRRTRR